ncbi:MAG: putative lipoprotein, partial [Myxococcaceae bacterium]|nr:putative lipoprotein [Myxococcaceae bacterium]
DVDRDSYGQTGAGGPICLDDAGTRVARAGDCLDTDPATHPDAVEICNGLDDDCDGTIDDGTCLPDGGWKLRPDTGGPGEDWETATNYGRGQVWLAERQRVFLRPGSGTFREVGSGCANKLYSSWSDPATGVAYFGGEGVFTTHNSTSTGCGSVETLSGTIVGLQGFGTRLYGATRDGRLVEARTGSVSVRAGFTGGVRVNDVQGASPDSLFAVGENGDRPKVWRMTTDGGPFVDERVDLLPVPDQELTAVWAVDDGLAYAVGSRGALLERSDAGWRALGPADGGLRAVRAFGPGRIYAATSDGRVLRYDGARWQLLYRHPVPVLFTDITASAEDDIWVVGHNGVVVHWLE